MDVISRKKNEQIVIGDNIFVTVIEIRGDKVRIGIECPKDTTAHRKECLDAMKQLEVPFYWQNQVVNAYPPKGNLQLMRLKAATEFPCSRCKTTKKAKLVAVVSDNWNELLCNGCYGKLLSERGEE